MTVALIITGWLLLGIVATFLNLEWFRREWPGLPTTRSDLAFHTLWGISGGLISLGIVAWHWRFRHPGPRPDVPQRNADRANGEILPPLDPLRYVRGLPHVYEIELNRYPELAAQVNTERNTT